jgi:hypothetical protein
VSFDQVGKEAIARSGDVVVGEGCGGRGIPANDGVVLREDALAKLVGDGLREYGGVDCHSASLSIEPADCLTM